MDDRTGSGHVSFGRYFTQKPRQSNLCLKQQLRKPYFGAKIGTLAATIPWLKQVHFDYSTSEHEDVFGTRFVFLLSHQNRNQLCAFDG